MRRLLGTLLFCGAFGAIIDPSSAHLYSQSVVVITSPKKLAAHISLDSLKRMVEVKSIIPDIIYDLRYASANNFTRQKLYVQGQQGFLRLAPARALMYVQQELRDSGYALKIFDAYRPYSVTKKMWKLIQDERYVANPAKASNHNRGLAVDLTMVDLKTSEETDMGTGFDNFSDTAHHSFTNLKPDVLRNRSLLRQTMVKHGFTPLETEWWHYSWTNDRNYEVLDLRFEQLKKLEKQKNATGRLRTF
ncbi:MAG TPA: M15 family metallopeptidase [Chitinophagaceae bacterium]|nr:M15 family metallopeptidase [Chitinophagaceae bacterium]